MKIRPVRAELFHADGQIDMTKLIVAFRNFVNAPKNRWQFSIMAHVWLMWQLVPLTALQSSILWRFYGKVTKTAFVLQQTHAEVPNLCTNNTRLRKRLRRMRNLQKPSKTMKLVTTLMMPEPYVKTVW